MYSIIFHDNGIERRYNADSHFDATVLFHLLTKNFTYVQMLSGTSVVQEFKVL
jgi:hypothetical protein